MSRPIRNLAILVGINAYKNEISPLKTPVNDAIALAKILEGAYNYDVRKLLDTEATLQGFHSLMEDLKQGILTLSDNRTVKIEAYDQVLFYFAGHGIAFGGFDSSEGPQGYLIPQDAGNNDKSTFLPMQQLHDVLVELECLHLLVILDCCFAGAFRYSRNLVPYQKLYRERYERFMQGKAQQTLFSAAHDERALDVLTRLGIREENRTQENSPFAQVLLQALKADGDLIPDGVMTATELYVYLDDELAKLTDRQTPGLSLLKHHEKGQYIFEVPDFNPERLEQAPPLDESTNPYRGLQPYEPEHSELFFGRENAIADLVEQVKQTGELSLTVVVGASGCGKSSLVKAGLIPRLQQEQWQVIEPMSPGRTPFKSLARAILPETANQEQIDGFSHKLRQAPSSLMEQVNVNSSKASGKVLLAIDQLEELVTLCSSEQRKLFLDWLKRLLATNSEQLHIIMTVRSDFEPQFAEAVWQKSQWMAARFMVPPMTVDELRDVIEKPASEKVLFFEPPELVDRLIDDVVQMPGALPLLSFTLSELYLKYLERRSDNRTMTRDDYEQLGGVIGALTQRATEVYQSLVNQDSAYEQTIRHVILRMVAMSGGELTRRRVAEVELEYPEPEDERVKQVVQRFVNARLLVRGTNSEGQPYVEPAHDALVLGWQKLLEWKQEEEEDLILQRRLTPAALEWKDEQSSKFLWNANPRLDLLKQVSKSEDNWFNQTEAEFVQRSVRKRRKNIATRWGIAVAVMLGLSGLTLAALMGQRDTLIGQIRNARQASEASLLSNQGLEALINSIRAAKSFNHLLLQVFPPKVGLENQVQGTLQKVASQVRERNRLEGHSGFVDIIRFSPDGKLLATTSEDGTAKLWDTQGNQLAAFGDSEWWVDSVHFSPDGELLVVTSIYGKAKLWDTQGNQLAAFNEHLERITDVRFSPDGKFIATASQDKTAKLWNIRDNQHQVVSLPHNGKVNSLSFSPNGELLATASGDGTVRLWDTQGNQLNKPISPGAWVKSASFSPDGKYLTIVLLNEYGKKTIKLLNIESEQPVEFERVGDLKSAAFSPKGKLLASVSRDGTLTLRKLGDNQRQLIQINTFNRNYDSVRFSPNGKFMAAVSEDTVDWFDTQGDPVTRSLEHSGIVRGVSFDPDGKLLGIIYGGVHKFKLWDQQKNQLIQIGGMVHPISSISFSPDSQLLATAFGSTVKLWDVEGSHLPKLKELSSQVKSASFSSNGKYLATVLRGGTIQLLNIKGKEISTFNGNFDSVEGVSPDGELLITASEDDTATLWNNQGNQLKTFEHLASFNSISFSADGERLAIASAGDFIAKLWDTQSNQLETFEHLAPVNSVSFSPDGKRLATASKDRTVKLWDIQGNQLVTFKGHLDWVTDVSFSPDGKYLATASEDGTAKLWDIQGNQLETFEHSTPVSGVRFSPSGKLLVTIASKYSTATLWDIQGNQLAIFEHLDWINSVRFSPDGERLATASDDGTAKLWDTQGNQLAVFKHSRRVTDISFSSDGKYLATASSYGTAKLWKIEGLDELLIKACNQVRDYLNNPNADIDASDRRLCNDIGNPQP